MSSLTVNLTDASTALVFHLPEGAFTLHTSSTNRPNGVAKQALVRPKVKRRQLVGYVVEEIIYDKGRHTLAQEITLDLALVQKSGRP